MLLFVPNACAGGFFFCHPLFERIFICDDDLQGVNPTAAGKKFAPLGGGLRLCPGSELGKVEVAIFLHHLVLSYRWRLDGEDDDVPMAHPYVEFRRGLPIEISSCHRPDPTPWLAAGREYT